MEPRNYEASAVAAPPDAPASPSNGYPTDGDPTNGVRATQPGAHWFYKIGESLRAAIVGGGKAPSDDDLTLLNQVINASATESQPGKAEIATQTETNTGTDDTRIVTPKKLKASPGRLAPGDVFMHAGSVAPPGALIIDASELDKLVFDDLYAAIGDLWNTTGGVAAPAAGNFRIPPSKIAGKGLFVRGVGAVGVGVFESDIIRNITGTHAEISGGAIATGVFAATGGQIQHLNTATSGTHTAVVFDASTVVPTGTENRPKSITMLLCIKY